MTNPLPYQSPGASRQEREALGWSTVLARLGPLVGLLFVFVLFTSLTGSRFANTANFELMLRQTAVVGIAALGMTVIIVSGGIDLSVGSNLALGTVVTALMLSNGFSPVSAASAGVVVCGLSGLVIGTFVIGRGARAFGFIAALLLGLWLVHVMHMRPAPAFALATPLIPAMWMLDRKFIGRVELMPFIVTLGMWGALRGVAKGIAGNQVIYPPPAWKQSWLNGMLKVSTWSPRWVIALLVAAAALTIADVVASALGATRFAIARRVTLVSLPFIAVGAARIVDGRWPLLPPGVWLLLFLAAICAGVLSLTRFGRHVLAVGSNEKAARLCGVPVERTKIFIYVIGGLLAGLAGLLEFSYISMGDPTTRTGAELDVIAAVVIGGASLSGGQGSIFGSLVGALIMTMISNGCTKMGWDDWVQQIVTGGIIIFAVYLDRLRHRQT